MVCLVVRRISLSALLSASLITQSTKNSGAAFSPLQQCRSKRMLTHRHFGTTHGSPSFVGRILDTKKVLINNKNTGRIPPRPSFEEAWEAVRDELDRSNRINNHVKGSRWMSSDEALRKLKVPMTTAYSTEKDFNKAMFEALRECLGTAYELHQADPNAILLNIGITQEYAVGIARLKCPALNLVPAEMLKQEPIECVFTSTGMNVKSALDQTVCLFQKFRNSWSVKDCFAVIELAMNATSCDEFGYEYGEVSDTIEVVDIKSRHAALGKVILHNMGCVLLYHAKNGVLGRSIPLALIAGTMKEVTVGLNGLHEWEEGLQSIDKYADLNGPREWEEQKEQQHKIAALRWVSGRLEIPKACGDVFCYSIQDFGRFTNDADDQSVEHALSLYIETILFGLKAAIAVQNKLAEGKVPLETPASGQSLQIGNLALDLQFCSSPIPGAIASSIYDTDRTGRWSVSQGELFRGKLDVGQVLGSSNARLIDFLRGKKKRAATLDVVVKASSLTVHNILARPADVFYALREIHLAETSLVKEVGSVLYAVILMKAGLLTIMADLTKEGYGPLKPIDGCGDLALLWESFQDLVERVLLPMAKCGIIHADIQPGFDVTTNILCKRVKGRFGKEKVELKLIDFESLVFIERMSSMNFYAFMEVDQDWDATTFVWWQCMSVAFMWKEGLKASSLCEENYLKKMKKALLSDDGLMKWPWLGKYRERAKAIINAETLISTISDLREEFVALHPQRVSKETFQATQI